MGVKRRAVEEQLSVEYYRTFSKFVFDKGCFNVIINIYDVYERDF